MNQAILVSLANQRFFSVLHKMCSSKSRNFQLVCAKDHRMEAVIGFSYLNLTSHNKVNFILSSFTALTLSNFTIRKWMKRSFFGMG